MDTLIAQPATPSPLLWAADRGYAEVCQSLLRRGYSPNTTNEHGYTALHIATLRRDVRFARWLLEHPEIDVNAENWEGETALAMAASLGKSGEDVFQLLMERADVDVNWCDRSGRTILCRAAEVGNEVAIEKLLRRHDIRVNELLRFREKTESEEPVSAFYMAVEAQNLRVVQAFLTRNDLNLNQGSSALICAVRHASESSTGQRILELILERRDVDLNRVYNGLSPLAHAANDPDTTALKLLLARDDLDLNSRDFDFDILAYDSEFTRERVEPVEQQFVKAETSPSASGQADTKLAERRQVKSRLTPLQLAICLNHEEAVRLLLARGDIDPNRTGSNSFSPAALASCLKGRDELLAALREKGGINWDMGEVIANEVAKLDLSPDKITVSVETGDVGTHNEGTNEKEEELSSADDFVLVDGGAIDVETFNNEHGEIYLSNKGALDGGFDEGETLTVVGVCEDESVSNSKVRQFNEVDAGEAIELE